MFIENEIANGMRRESEKTKRGISQLGVLYTYKHMMDRDRNILIS